MQCLDAAGQPKADGAACDDGRACTQGDSCKAGVCTSGAQKCPCEPGILDCDAAKTVNQCKGPLACAAAPAGAALPYACAADTALAVVCDPSADGACSKSACVPLSGACTPTAVERTIEVCDLPPGPDGAPGCRREVLAADLPDGPASACDDGLACSTGDVCAKGACQTSDVAACTCLQNADCQDDGDACNGLPFCDKSGPTWACKVSPATVVTCDTSSDGGCLQTACAPATGQCNKGFAAANKSCDDGVACTVGDVCDGQGGCLAGTWTCCKSDADCQKKEDGNACNGTLFCNKAAGACQLNPATVVSCPSVEDTACAKAACDPKSGACAQTPVTDKTTCNDDDACTDGDACKAGQCQGGTDTCICGSDADCKGKDAGDLCNGTYYCNKAIGKCKLNPATVITCPTVDVKACSHSQCQAKTGQCAMVNLPAATTCDADGTACTSNDSCDGQGACVPGTLVCPCQADSDCAAAEDGDICNGTLYCDKSGKAPACKVNPATVMSCKSVDDSACVHNLCQPKPGLCAMTPLVAGAPCSDGVPCTGGDGCDGKGACKAGPVVLCGCKGDGDCAVFDDGDVCNGVFACKEGGCAFDGKVAACDDGNPCTKDGCDKAAGCTAAPLPGCVTCANDAGCDDGNGCTVDFCTSGVCTVKAVSGLLCDDGNACTTVDSCQGGACKAGGAKDCDDGKVCTDDGCDAKTGCGYTANSKPCDDGDSCSEGETCKAGKCAHGPDKCVDGNVCTDDSCDDKGVCSFQTNNKPCDADGTVCTVGDGCGGGKCLPGAATACDDANPCTDDSCDAKVGCVFANHQKPCNDGNACTLGEACGAGKCGNGLPLVCDDKEACTADSCDKAKGCAHDAAALQSQACTAVPGGKCLWGTCLVGCSAGSEEVEIDIAGVKGSACAALGPVWGHRPDKPQGVFTVKEVGGENVVEDSQTKLIWQQTSSPQTKNWADAKGYCNALVYAGFKDWRLPSMHELESLVDYSIQYPGPMIDGKAFPGTKNLSWSASPGSESSSASAVNFYVGAVGNAEVNQAHQVRQA